MSFNINKFIENKNIFIVGLILMIILILTLIIIFSVLGSKTRIGYLDFNLNTDKTLELNYLTDIKEDFIIDDKLDEKSLNNYLLTNENITNYVYHFKMGYYDKIFKHSDIYGVYPDLSNLPDYIKEAEMDMAGSPFGNFVSSKIIEEDRIDNIEYILKIHNNIIIILFILLIFLLPKFKYSKFLYIDFIIIIFILMIIRKPEAIFKYQVLIDDALFIQSFLDNPLKSIFVSFNGYFNVIPSLITALSLILSQLSGQGITLTPFFMNIFSGIVGAFCISYILTNRFEYLGSLRIRLLISLLIIYMPYSLQILLYATNLHWILAYFLFLISLDIVVKRKIPKKGGLLIFIFLCSLSSIYAVFLSIAGVIYLFYTIIEFKKNRYYRIIINTIISIIVLNLGTLIQIVKILLAGRTSGEKNIFIGFISLFTSIITRLFSYSFYIPIENKSLLILSFLFSMAVFILLIRINLKIDRLFILLYFILSVLFVQFGTNYYFLDKYIFSNFRYNFLPISIILTYIFSNINLNCKIVYTKDNINIGLILKPIHKIVFSLLTIIIIFINYFNYNKSNIGDFVYYYNNWKNISKLYNKNGKENIFIYGSYTYGISIPADIIYSYNIEDFIAKNDSQIKEFNYEFDNKFSWMKKNIIYKIDSTDINQITSADYLLKEKALLFFYAKGNQSIGIDINSDGNIDMYINNGSLLDNGYSFYIIDLSKFKDISINIIFEPNNRYVFFSDIFIIKKTKDII